jgi:radical SAM superfamily enzyme YgiQ (UPF0313 family)
LFKILNCKMSKKIIGLSFPENSTNLGLEPSILNVLPPGENVEYSRTNRRFNDSEVDKYLCSVYIAGIDEFRQWAMQHDTRKIVVGGYHPTMFPEDFLNLADKIIIGPCDDIDATLSQKGVQFERGHYNAQQIGNSRFVAGKILRNLQHVDGWLRVHGEILKEPEQASGIAEVLEDRILPGVLTFRNIPRYDLYNILNNQQVIPDKKLDDLATSVNSSFGCPYKCDFCCTPVMFPKLIVKPLPVYEREIDVHAERLKAADPENRKQRFMFFRDENFPLIKDYKERLQIASKKLNAKLYLFASANKVTEETADAFAENNVYMVCLGLEDPTKDYAKNRTLKEAVQRLKDRGIYTYLSFIVDPTMMVGRTGDGGTGADKAKAFYKLLYERFEELQPEMVCGNFLMPFPGTPLWDDYYWMVNEQDFKHYDSKTPFLVKNQLVAEKMKYFMFEIQWRYYASELYNSKVRKFDAQDTLYLRFKELKDQFDDALDILHLRP